MLCHVDFFDGFAAHGRNLLRRSKRAQSRDRRHDHVDRIVGAETFGQNIVDSGQLEYRAHRSPSDDAGAGSRGFQQDGSRADFMSHFVRNGAIDHRYGDEAFTSLLDTLANRFGHLAGPSDCETDLAFAVADDDQCTKAEALAALNDLGNAIDAHDGFFKSAGVAFTTTVLHQNVNPASRAASASARTRP